MARITNVTQEWLKDLENLDRNKDIIKAAFYNVWSQYADELHTILVSNYYSALDQAPEFAIPEFSDPLVEAIWDAETIQARLNDSFRVIVTIDLDTTAGELSDYAQAVDLARTNYNVGGDIGKASRYWQFAVYGSEEKYGMTLQDRFAAMESPAPYWSLIEYGNVAGGAQLSQGGIAYPQNPPTGFVALSEREGQDFLEARLSDEVRKIMADLEAEVYGGRQVVEDAFKVVEELDFNDARPYTPSPVIEEIRTASKFYDAAAKVGSVIAGAFKNIFGRK